MEKDGTSLVISETGKFRPYRYKSEKELEEIFVRHAKEVFGQDTCYLDFKKKMTSKGGISGIPDGFLIDFGNDKFYIVEVELRSHDPVSHISNQVVRFKAAMNSGEARAQLARNLYDTMLEKMPKTDQDNKGHDQKYFERVVNQAPGIFIIIDSISKRLTEVVSVLSSQEGGEVMVIPFETYADSKNNHIHKFTTYTRDALEKEAKKWSFKWTTVPVEKHLDRTSGYMKGLFSALSSGICRWPDVKEKSRKGWVTYQTSPLKNFCTIKILPTGLEVYLKADKNFQDGRGITKSIKRTQAWTFDKVFTLNSRGDMDYALRLIKQAYDCICQKG